MSDETVRLTYAELARARGITPAAAKRMALRHRWPKQIGNDGLSRVSVPASALVRQASPVFDDPSVITSVSTGDDARDSACDAASDDVLPSSRSAIDETLLAVIIDAAVAASDDARAAAVADASADARRAVRALEETVT